MTPSTQSNTERPLSVREMRERLQRADAIIGEVHDAALDLGGVDRSMWGPGFAAVFDLDRARRRLRIAERAMAKSDDPRLEPLAPLPRIRVKRA